MNRRSANRYAIAIATGMMFAIGHHGQGPGTASGASRYAIEHTLSTEPIRAATIVTAAPAGTAVIASAGTLRAATQVSALVSAAGAISKPLADLARVPVTTRP